MARYKLDFVVDDAVVVEVKSTKLLNPNDVRQFLNYLRATPFSVGLLLHFGPKAKFKPPPGVSPRACAPLVREWSAPCPRFQQLVSNPIGAFGGKQ